MKAILTFHSIDESGSVLSYEPKAFASLVDALADSDLPVVALDRLLQAETHAGVAITFDDGMRSVFTAALPVIRDHGIPAHLFLTTGFVAGKNRWPDQPSGAPVFEMLSWFEIERLHSSGIFIESHTHSHPDLRGADESEVLAECETADSLIEQRLGRQPRYFAYPYGHSDRRVRACVGSRYGGAVTTVLRTLRSGEDPSRLPRIDSYYLRNQWMRTNLDSTLSRLYLSLRGTLRYLRGTQ